MNTIDYLIEQIKELEENEFLQIGEKTVIEDAGYHQEYGYIIVFHSGFRQGYVCAPRNSLFDSTTNDPKEFEGINPSVIVHGGLTFSGTKLPFQKVPTGGEKWFGFKANHATDEPDINALRKYNMIYDLTRPMQFLESSVKNLNFMKYNCRRLIDGLVALEMDHMMQNANLSPNIPGK